MGINGRLKPIRSCIEAKLSSFGFIIITNISLENDYQVHPIHSNHDQDGEHQYPIGGELIVGTLRITTRLL